jgi:hypothetical protein
MTIKNKYLDRWDLLVYELYDFTDEEIKIVEESV